MKKPYYVIVSFEIDPKQFSNLIELIKSFFEKEVSTCPGFISSRILSNEDQNKVVNYATWESKEKFEKFANEVAATSKISLEIAEFNPIRETFYEYEYLAKSE
ncbi:antibiotic biosynthesis monooxygenase family protein [Zunongwangia sp. HGR-M22]|uniref:antibiotic biosynthesis monooxygenase family protein n=1 Tax=Zunongwangia sp. HGR-M22 TaxID=3015168 RepID=UPI0022DD495C|nr:antibiotic biosynthesis monooxygenase [Zunongwangia sp. HGR-M22]WBL24764.1 antibiotic biosynthesis monooxygenase [Zunongwangia sp. HGR-M22]